ncbi:hypothetical protein F4808DRAFT_413643 [Astrocystis sublimbata]|nr:hypothetical protein F4808DRAFT_413643 [Astrocystis sublimbata]
MIRQKRQILVVAHSLAFWSLGITPRHNLFAAPRPPKEVITLDMPHRWRTPSSLLCTYHQTLDPTINYRWEDGMMAFASLLQAD